MEEKPFSGNNEKKFRQNGTCSFLSTNRYARCESFQKTGLSVAIVGLWPSTVAAVEVKLDGLWSFSLVWKI